MAQIDNLRKKDLEGLSDFVGNLKQENPEITMKTYPMDEKPVDYKELAGKIDALSRKIDLIFGDAVLIDGKFKNIK